MARSLLGWLGCLLACAAAGAEPEAAATPARARDRRLANSTLVHLVVPLFGGAAAWSSPLLPLFTASASAAGVRLTLLGDAAPPYALPRNVRHVLEPWPGLRGRLEKVAGREFADLPPSLEPADREGRAGWSPKRLNAISGYKPLLRLLYPEVFDDTAVWIGWSDCDVLLGRGLLDLAAAADAAGAHLVAPADDGPESKTRKLSWGPLTLLRRDAYDAVVAPALRAYLAAPATPAPRETFDEWGFRRWGGAGFAHSFSGILRPLVEKGRVTPFKPPLDPSAPPLFDACCAKGLRHLCPADLRELAESATCGYCKFDRGRLSGPAGEDYFLCHFQFSKRGWKANATEALRLAAAPAFLTAGRGAWFEPLERAPRR